MFGYIFQTDVINYIYGHLGYFVCCLVNISSNIIALFYYILYATNSRPNLATLFLFLESNKFLLYTLVGQEEEDTAAAGYPPADAAPLPAAGVAGPPTGVPAVWQGGWAR